MTEALPVPSRPFSLPVIVDEVAQAERGVAHVGEHEIQGHARDRRERGKPRLLRRRLQRHGREQAEAGVDGRGELRSS